MKGSSEESAWAGIVRGAFLGEEDLRGVGVRNLETAEEAWRGISNWENSLSEGLGARAVVPGGAARWRFRGM